jgi:hypothetical protein
VKALPFRGAPAIDPSHQQLSRIPAY